MFNGNNYYFYEELLNIFIQLQVFEKNDITIGVID